MVIRKQTLPREKIFLKQIFQELLIQNQVTQEQKLKVKLELEIMIMKHLVR